MGLVLENQTKTTYVTFEKYICIVPNKQYPRVELIKSWPLQKYYIYLNKQYLEYVEFKIHLL